MTKSLLLNYLTDFLSLILCFSCKEGYTEFIHKKLLERKI